MAEEMRTRWIEWAKQLSGPEQAEAVADTAINALAAGADVEEAAAAARIKAGRGAPADVARLEHVRATLSAAISALGTLRPAGALTEEATSAAIEQLRGRLTLLGAQAPSPLPQARARPPRPSLRAFLATRSIQLLAYSGALLLLVATLLFDLSGSSASRFWAVAALDALFAVAGILTMGRAALRPVSTVYVALASLLLPLVALAAYVFLQLGNAGITVAFAVGVTGSACAVVYALVALRLDSEAYGSIALAAGAVGVGGFGVDWLPQWWPGAAVTALGAVYALLGLTRIRPLRRPAMILGFALPAVGVGWADGARTAYEIDVALTSALGAAIAGYAVPAFRKRGLWVVPALVLLPFSMSLNKNLGGGEQSAQIALVGVGGVWLAIGLLAPLGGGAARIIIRIAASGLFVAIAGLSLGETGWVQAGIAILAATAIFVMALRTGQPVWVLPFAAAAGFAWYWLASAALPPKPNATAADLALVMSPLPALFGIAALVARDRWRWAPLVSFAVLALLVVDAALVPGSEAPRVAGGALLIYAILVEVSALRENRAWQAAIGAAAWTTALLLLVWSGPARMDWYLAAASSGAAVAFAVSRAAASRRSDLRATLQTFALALSAAVAIAAWPLAEHAATEAGLAIVAAGVATAAWWLDRVRPVAYLPALMAGLLGPAAAHALNLQDLQWQTVLPAVVLMGSGIVGIHDAGLAHRVGWARGVEALGAAAFLGVGAVQSFVDAATTSPVIGHTAWLVVESVAVLVAAVAVRSRVLVVGAAVGMVWASLMAVTFLARTVPLSLIFAVIALILIVVATGLAIARDRLGGATSTMRSSWGLWT